MDENITSPFQKLPYTAKNWYLSVFKFYDSKNPRGRYTVALRPLNTSDTVNNTETSTKVTVS